MRMRHRHRPELDSGALNLAEYFSAYSLHTASGVGVGQLLPDHQFAGGHDDSFPRIPGQFDEFFEGRAVNSGLRQGETQLFHYFSHQGRAGPVPQQITAWAGVPELGELGVMSGIFSPKTSWALSRSPYLGARAGAAALPETPKPGGHGEDGHLF